MRVSGLDLSFTSTGASRLIVGSALPPVVARIAPRTRLGTGHLRLHWLVSEAIRWSAGSDLVVIEGPAFDRNQGQHQLGGLWWAVAHGLWASHVPYVVVSPNSLKMYALGKGVGNKDQVIAAVVRRYPMVDVTCNDEADALVLAAMAADYYGHPVVQVPETHRRALNPDKVHQADGVTGWPEMKELAA